MFSLTFQDQELLDRLNRHPQLKSRMESLLSMIDEAGDDVVKADDAERQIIEEMRRMGNEVLSGWAESYIAKAHNNLMDTDGVVNSGKKNSIGILPLVKFK